MVEPAKSGSPLKPENVVRKSTLFEPVALVLLSLATVGTAWCSFETAVWSSISQRLTNLSTAASRRAVTDQLKGYQMALLDVVLFSQYVNARASSNEALAQYYTNCFRGEAKVAFHAWMALQGSPDAPAHPFVTNLYQPRLWASAQREEDKSEALWQQAGEAGRTARSYVLITVLLACALFCGGSAAKFEQLWIRRAVIALGLVAFLFAVGRLATLPMQQ